MARRTLSQEEIETLHVLAGDERKRIALRVAIVLRVASGAKVNQTARELGVTPRTVRKWVARYDALGVDGFEDDFRPGRPEEYGEECLAVIVSLISVEPAELGLPFGSWTIRNLERYLNEVRGISIRRSRINSLLNRGGYYYVKTASAPMGRWLKWDGRQASQDVNASHQSSP